MPVDESSAVTVRQAEEQLLALLDAEVGGLPSERLVAVLEEKYGVEPAVAATAMAYSLQHGRVNVDWAFRVRRRPQPA